LPSFKHLPHQHLCTHKSLIFFFSTLSLCFTSPSLLHVCLSPSVSVSVSGAPLSLPYPLIQPLTLEFIPLTALHSFNCYSIYSFLNSQPSLSHQSLFKLLNQKTSSARPHQGKVSFSSISPPRFFSPFYVIGNFWVICIYQGPHNFHWSTISQTLH
jgi:hypothetical protein